MRTSASARASGGVSKMFCERTAVSAAEIHPAVPAGDVPGAVRFLSGEYQKRGGAAALPFAEFIHGELETPRALVREKTD